MNDAAQKRLEKRLEQAREEYEEFLRKLFDLKIAERLSVEAQWELSTVMIKLRQTLNPEMNTKTLMAAARKGRNT